MLQGRGCEGMTAAYVTKLLLCSSSIAWSGTNWDRAGRNEESKLTRRHECGQETSEPQQNAVTATDAARKGAKQSSTTTRQALFGGRNKSSAVQVPFLP